MRDGNPVISLNFDFPLSQWQPLSRVAPIRSPEFIRFCKENFTCCVTGAGYDLDYHHLIKGKSRHSGSSDFIGIVLRHDIHLLIMHGKFGGDCVKFAQHFKLDLQALLKKQAIAFALHLGVSGTFTSLSAYEQAVRRKK